MFVKSFKIYIRRDRRIVNILVVFKLCMIKFKNQMIKELKPIIKIRKQKANCQMFHTQPILKKVKNGKIKLLLLLNIVAQMILLF